MKKILFILFLLPIICHGQTDTCTSYNQDDSLTFANYLGTVKAKRLIISPYNPAIWCHDSDGTIALMGSALEYYTHAGGWQQLITSASTVSTAQLADTAAAIRSAIPNTSSFATQVGLNDSVSYRIKYSDTTTKYYNPRQVDSFILSLGYHSGTVTSITAGTGLSGGTITTSGTISLPNTGTSGTYNYPSQIITDAQGRVTSATGGSAPVDTATIAGTGIGITRGTNSVTVNVLSTSVNATPITIGGNTTITAAPSGSAGGDLTGSYPNPTISTAKTITLTAGSGVSIVGTATQTLTSVPAYTITATGSGGTVTNVIAGTNISITGTSTIQPTVNISGTIATSNGGTGATTTTSVNGTPISYGVNNTLPIGTGTVTSVTVNSMTPLFTTSVATSTTTPVISYTAITENAHTFYGVTGTANATPAFSQVNYSDLTGTMPTSTLTVNATSMVTGNAYTITAAANTLTTTTLNPTVVTSSLTSVGTITSGTWSSVISGTATGSTQANLTNNTTIATTAYADIYNGHDSSVAMVASLTPYSLNANRGYTVNYEVTGATGTVTVNNQAGSWQQGQILIINFTDNGTSRTIAWGTHYKPAVTPTAIALPITTVIGQNIAAELIWNAANSEFFLSGLVYNTY